MLKNVLYLPGLKTNNNLEKIYLDKGFSNVHHWRPGYYVVMSSTPWSLADNDWTFIWYIHMHAADCSKNVN